MIVFQQATWPSSPQSAGASLTVSYIIYNSGTAGSVDVFLKSGSSVLTYRSHSIDALQTASGSLTWTMASSDMAMSLASSNGGSASKTIQVLIQVSTSLTLSLSPTSVSIGGTVTASGRLTRADGVSASGRTISVKKGTSVVASATTDSSGNFSATFTAPSTAGSYSYNSYFAGAGPLASAASTPRSIMAGVEGVTPQPWVTILAPLAMGVVLIKVARTR